MVTRVRSNKPLIPEALAFVLTPDVYAELMLQKWCKEHGYTELQYQDGGWWAIPPDKFLPVPLDEEKDYPFPYTHYQDITRNRRRL